MIANFLLALFAASASVNALPQAGSAGSSSTSPCGEGAMLACCNNSTDGPILGVNCFTVPVLAVPIDQPCGGSNVAQCCGGDATSGLLNLDAACFGLTA